MRIAALRASLDRAVPGTGREDRTSAGEVIPAQAGGRQLRGEGGERQKEGVYRDPNRGAVTLRIWAEQWIASLVVGDSTRRNYRGFLDNWLLPALGRKTLAGLTRSDVQALVNKMHAAGLAASTISDRLIALRTMLRAAIADHRIVDNPCDGVSLPRKGIAAVNPDEIPTLAQVDAIAEAMDERYGLTVWLMAGCGMRISEALAFSQDCDRGEFLRLYWQVSPRANGKRLVPLKHRTEGEYRDVPLPPFPSAEIAAHIDRWGTSEMEGVRALFPGSKIPVSTVATYTPKWHKALSSAGLSGFTPHDLRHFFASAALGGGVPLLEVSRWLGHRKIEITADTYGHLVPEAGDRVRAVMQQALRPPLKVVS